MTDHCPSCDGVWFDAPELSLLFKYLEDEAEASTRIAHREISELEDEKSEEIREEILDGKRVVGRRNFWRVLFGMSPE